LEIRLLASPNTISAKLLLNRFWCIAQIKAGEEGGETTAGWKKEGEGNLTLPRWLS
jgi:hypothetical protein